MLAVLSLTLLPAQVNGTPIRWKSYSEVVRALSAQKDLHLLLTSDESALPVPSNSKSSKPASPTKAASKAPTAAAPVAAAATPEKTEEALPAYEQAVSPTNTSSAALATPTQGRQSRDQTRTVVLRRGNSGLGMRLVSDERSAVYVNR